MSDCPWPLRLIKLVYAAGQDSALTNSRRLIFKTGCQKEMYTCYHSRVNNKRSSFLKSEIVSRCSYIAFSYSTLRSSFAKDNWVRTTTREARIFEFQSSPLKLTFPIITLYSIQMSSIDLRAFTSFLPKHNTILS